jgi:N-acetylglucosamine kinase-like BadF-type ATPase
VKRVAGIDGGQTSTVAAIVDERGVVLGRGSAGPSDHVGQAADSSRAARACTQALAQACAAAGLAADAPFEAVAIGLSGYEGAWHGREPVFAARTVRYVHDATAALAGAIADRPAGVVIAGTGSAAYAEGAKGESARAGGYGYLFGDGGGAFSIARTALAEAMEAADRGVRTDLGDAALPYFDVPDLRALARAVSLDQIARPQIAGFSRVVLDAARFGDPAAAAIVEDAAASIARLARAVAERLATAGQPMPVAFVGGIAEHPLVATAVRAGLARAARIAIVSPAHDAAVGAAFLAFDAAGLPRPAIVPA